jgi:hypothetical protein
MYIEDGVTDASGYHLSDLRGAVEAGPRTAAATRRPQIAAFSLP